MAPRVTDRPDMASYGVPEDLDGVLPWSWATDHLVESRCYWVCTITAESRPHSMPVWGAWLDDPEGVFFSCSPDSRKVRNLAGNPAVTVTTDDASDFVSLEGDATLLEGGPALDNGINAFFDKYGEEMGQPREEVDTFLRDNTAYLVRPTKAFGMIETPEDFGPRATRWRW